MRRFLVVSILIFVLLAAVATPAWPARAQDAATPATPVADATPSAAPIGAPFGEVVYDAFDGDRLDGSLWDAPTDEATIEASAGTLTLAPPADSTRYATLRSAQSFNLLGGGVRVTVDGLLLDRIGSEVVLGVEPLDTEGSFVSVIWAGNGKGGGVIARYFNEDGYHDTEGVAYDAAAMRVWQIRMEGRTLVWEYAPEPAGPWTPLSRLDDAAAKVGMAFTGVRVSLNAGTYRVSSADVGAARFGRVVVASPLVDAPLLRGDAGRSGTAPGPGPSRLPAAAALLSADGPFASTPAIAAGILYVGSGDGSLYALDVRSGEPVWRFEAEGPIASSPAVSGATVYVGSDDGSLYALDAKDGEPRWRLATDGAVSSSPVVVDDVVYVGSADGALYAVDATSGELRWQLPLGTAVLAPPAVASGVVYAASDGVLFAVDAAAGFLVWQTGAEALTTGPAVVGGTVYAGDANGMLHLLDASTGADLGRLDVGGGAITSAPSIEGDVAYVAGDDGTVVAVDTTSGDVLWDVRTGGTAAASIVLVGGRLYAVAVNGRAYAVDAATGEVVWRAKVDGPIASSITAAAGRIYVGTREGVLYQLVDDQG